METPPKKLKSYQWEIWESLPYLQPKKLHGSHIAKALPNDPRSTVWSLSLGHRFFQVESRSMENFQSLTFYSWKPCIEGERFLPYDIEM